MDVGLIDELGFMNDDVDVMSDIYALEMFHYEIVKDNLRIHHMEAVKEDYEIITEALSDIVTKMGEFFKKMVTAIKEFFKKLFMYIASYFMDIDKFVKKYKTELDKITKVEFSIVGNKFTIQEEPDMSELQKIVNTYNDGLSDLGSMKKDEILKQQNDYLDNKNLNEIRGNMVHQGPMEEDDFQQHVRELYRDGESDTVSIDVDISLFRSTVAGIDKLVKDKKNAEKIRDKTIDLFARAEKFFSQKVTTMYKDKEKVVANDPINMDMKKGTFKSDSDKRVYSSDGRMDVVNTFVRFKYAQTRAVSGLANIVVREYANAYKDNVKMARQIIQKALMNMDTKTDSSSNAKGGD